MAFYTVSNVENLRICVVMVGLPARGKSFIAQKIVRYLSWLSIKAKCFNVGNYRRKAGSGHPDAEFFDFNNKAAFKIRQKAAEAAAYDMMKWYEEENGVVAILDGTNTTRERRDWILKICRERAIEPMFLESWSDDTDMILRNISDVKTSSPDYEGVDPDVATSDFLERIAKYEQVYEPLDREKDKNLTYVKLINVAQEVVINRIQTYLESRVVFYVMNLHIRPRCIWLSRHGESVYNVEKKIGGDSCLSERGFQYAKKLPELVKQSAGDADLTIWTSTLIRTQQTAQDLPYKQLQWKALDELDAGVCDGMTYEEIEEKYPGDFKARDENKYEYRYPGGESYRDVVIRLEPIIMELERQENILIVTHQAVLRCIYAYFMNVPQEESPWMSIPLHTLIKLEPKAYGTEVTKIKANIPAVSTYKEKGTSRVGESTQDGTKYQNFLLSIPESKR
ncbi:ZYBA0S06-05292g1_1 [Zygosaccharomyces bailii CLIB 213]|uniref:fructose-2,6-bisphosphate 2-phosphatase n=1 Tax=Zygosaccharomyces bailii (strain CLIB 213 / ATCC 58445 / CBS 680 / BCRC 21525 / NBRC 1098 / NCYC 1416 / NRRL Y-2227) TaxID=1333698 RepID=A0A8J2T8T6_ZYGB2|nr:ZYBA0S06-05292g1_1 [Zygosaccharomyces bailii CLIB 213]